MTIFSQIVFPILGICMILVALGAFFLPYGARLKEAIQKIDAFGVKLEISVITAIMLGGILFCTLGFYLNEYSNSIQLKKLADSGLLKDKQLDNLQTQITDRDERINNLTTQNITYHFVLDGLDANSPPPPAKSLVCIFYKNWRDETDSSVYKVFSSGSNAYKVTFENLSLQQLNDAAPAVYLYDKQNNKRWVSQSFNPLAPTISLSELKNNHQ